MAERRMFAKTIIDSDAFLDMPLSTQALYFHLSMRADDDGFVNNPKKIQRMIGASDDDLKLLAAKKFVVLFESGVVVIKHWKINNYIRSDRYKPTVYQEEKALLTEKENGSYTLGIPSVNHTVYQMDTQYRLVKDRIGKNRIELVKDRLDKSGGGDYVYIYSRAREAIIECYQKYFGATPTEYEIGVVNEYVCSLCMASDEEDFSFSDGERELLEIAFESAAKADKKTLAYIGGVFQNYLRRGIHTADDYWTQEYERDKARGTI